MKPRSEALSLVSNSDSGYDSEEWEYVDTEEEDEDPEEWEYFIETATVEVPRKELQNPHCKTPLEWRHDLQVDNVARTLKNWIKIIKDPSSEILICLEAEFKASSEFECPNLVEKLSLKPSVSKYTGGKDKKGKYHGEGELRYSNGSILWATFKHGVVEGKATLEHLNGDTFEGEFVNDKLEGWVNETYNIKGWRQTFYKKGVQV